METDEREHIIACTEQVIRASDLYVVDVEVKGSQSNRIVSVYLDSESGNITLDRCVNISKELQLVLDASGWHEKAYTLNVSSPGLDRPLKDLRQYSSNKGRQARVRYRKGDTIAEISGVLAGVKDRHAVIETETGSVEIMFDDIMETRIIASFK